MRLVMLGAPGAGKGTQAAKISEKYDIPHVSTGDILRSEIKKETEYGIKAKEYVESGRLVPDELVFDIIENFIKSDTAKKGFLLDGFPRNFTQAERFTGMLDRAGIDLDKVINIDPKNARAYKGRATAKLMLNDYKGSITEYNKAIELDPNNSSTYEGRGVAKLLLEDYTGALKDCDKSLMLNDTNLDAYGCRGTAKIALGKIESGCRDLRKSNAYEAINKYCN